MIFGKEYRPICYVTVGLVLVFAWLVFGDITVGYGILDSSVSDGVRYRLCCYRRSSAAQGPLVELLADGRSYLEHRIHNNLYWCSHVQFLPRSSLRYVRGYAGDDPKTLTK